MKKFLVLALALVLLVSIASMSFAATVTVDGNLRLWYGYVKNEATDVSETSFRFDRLALDVNAAFDQNSGLVSEVQFRDVNIGKDTAATSSKNGADLRVDLAYYFLKNALINGDTFMAGVFDGQVPYKNGYGYPLISSGIGDATKMSISTGVVYQITKPLWSIGAAVVNASQNTAQNDADNTSATSSNEGYAWSSRVNFTPFAGFKTGVGYAYVLDAAGTTTADAMWSHRVIADISYSNPAVCPISGMIEWSQISDKDKIKTDDSVSAIYGELGYTVGKAVIYAGRAVSLSDTNFFNYYDQNNGFVGYDSVKQTNNYTVFGVKYTVTPNTFLQGEAVTIDKSASFKNAEWLGLRYMVTF
jgi:hypothetical protein